jgi:hypothetical protein
MMSTGVPPHLAVSKEVASLKMYVEKLEKTITSQNKELPQQLTDTIMNKFTINGAIAVTHEVLQKELALFLERLKVTAPFNNNSIAVDALSALSSTSASSPQYKQWQWGGRMHMVPEGWRIPKVELSSLWALYWCGNAEQHIQPLRFLREFDFIDSNERKEWSKIKRIIEEISLITKENSVQRIKEITEMNQEERNNLFKELFISFLSSIYPKRIRQDNRLSQLSATSLYRSMNKKRKREREEAEEQRERQKPRSDNETSDCIEENNASPPSSPSSSLV